MARSKILKELINEMENDPWYVKLSRWCNVKKIVWLCRTRFIWDLKYEKNIFKRKNKLN